MNDLVTELADRIQQINTLLRANESQDLLDLRSRFSQQLETAQGQLYDQDAPAFGGHEDNGRS